MFHPMGGLPSFFPIASFLQQAPPLPPDLVIPVRVEKAMEFLELMFRKTMERAIASEHQVVHLDGQKLIPEEENTQTAALQLLQKYFDGKLPRDPWEDLRYAAISQRLQMAGRQDGSVIFCVFCGGKPPHPQCSYCHGQGRLLVFPVYNNQIMPPNQGENQSAERPVQGTP